MQKEYTIGIDIGSTKMTAGLVERSGALHSTLRVGIPAYTSSEEFIKEVGQVGRRLLTRARQMDNCVVGVGIGANAQIEYPKGKVQQTISTWRTSVGIELASELQPYFQLPVVADNRTNAMALAEYYCGTAQGYPTLFYILIGARLNGALIIDGKVHRGANCAAGNLAHFLVDWKGGRPCRCGYAGHLETYVTGPAIAENYGELIGLDAQTDLRKVAELAAAGDSLAEMAISEAAVILAKAMGGMIGLLDPSIVVLGGSVTELGNVWWQPLLNTVRNLPMPTAQQTPIKTVKLGPTAGTIGAGLLAFEHFDGLQ